MILDQVNQWSGSVWSSFIFLELLVVRRIYCCLTPRGKAHEYDHFPLLNDAVKSIWTCLPHWKPLGHKLGYPHLVHSWIVCKGMLACKLKTQWNTWQIYHQLWMASPHWAKSGNLKWLFLRTACGPWVNAECPQLRSKQPLQGTHYTAIYFLYCSTPPIPRSCLRKVPIPGASNRKIMSFLPHSFPILNICCMW